MMTWKGTVGTVIRKLSGLAARKRLAANAIGRHEVSVRPGLWLLHPDFNRTWNNRRLPSPLSLSKQPGSWPGRRLYGPLLALASWIIYPWFVVARLPVSRLAADVLLVNKEQELVGFDLKARKVFRTVEPERLAIARGKHSNLSRVYSCPPIETDELLLVQDFVVGTTFSAASSQGRLALMERVFAAVTDAASIHLAPSVEQRWHRSINETLRFSTLDLSNGNTGNLVLELLDGAKRSWIHGDLIGENVLVTPDGQMVVVDTEGADPGPSLADPLTLIISEARRGRPDMLAALHHGRFDPHFDSLGCKISNSASRTALFALWLAWRRGVSDLPDEYWHRFISIWNQRAN